MKNQYFGDVNDYRKYGLLRLLSNKGALRTGVCWMLTPNDTRPDGNKTEYLDDHVFLKFDPPLYEVLKLRVKGHETEPQSRDVKHFGEALLQNSIAWTQFLNDSAEDRRHYFEGMLSKFSSEGVQFVFFDADDGLANIGTAKRPIKKGHKNSSKKIFKDEVKTTFQKGFSVLLYQHFHRKERKKFANDLSHTMMSILGAPAAVSFITPHVLFLLIPHPDHHHLLWRQSQAVEDSAWSAPKSASTSEKSDFKQILVRRHSKP